jgi:hypothetical protein
MTRRCVLAVLSLLCFAGAALAEETGKANSKGGVAEGILGLFCAGVMGLSCFTVVVAGVLGLVWLRRRSRARRVGGLEDAFAEGVSGAIASGINDAFERHRRSKQTGADNQDAK